MAAIYKKLISGNCTVNGIAVTLGFGHNTPSLYGIIRTHLTPPELVATTWFAVADVMYFI